MIVAFVSSAIPELEPEQETSKKTLEGLGIKCIMWPDMPARPLPPMDFDAILKDVDRSDIFILILWKEYSKNVIKEYERAKSKHKPTFAFIKEIRGKEDRDRDLKGFIDSELSKFTSWKRFREQAQLELALKEAVVEEINRRFNTFLSHSHRGVYELATDIASSATEIVALLPRSLNLITGARPYTSDKKIDYEEFAYDAFWEVVKKAEKGEIKFMCSTIVPKTVKEIVESKIEKDAKDNLNKLFMHTSMKNPKSQFVLATPDPHWDSPFTFIVGDDRFAIWFKDPSSPEYQCVLSKDQKIATTLIHIWEDLCKPKSLEIMMKELQLI